MKHKILIVDDEPLARQLLKNMLKDREELEVIGEAGDGFEAFKLIRELEPELVFLDVQMPRLSGFEMLELLESPPAVIFTTAFDEYAMKAFDAHATDYLLKPLNKQRLEKAVEKFLSRKDRTATDVTKLSEQVVYDGYQHRIVVKDRDSIRIIPASEIQYVEANDDYVKIVTDTGSWLKKSTLARIEQSLDPKQFVRVHRSYLMPVSQLLKIEPYEKDSHIARLHCGAKVLVSKSGMARLKEVLGW